MTNEEVDRLLNQAVQEAAPNEWYKYTFARLVAAHEREACAKYCEELDRYWMNSYFPSDNARWLREEKHLGAKGRE